MKWEGHRVEGKGQELCLRSQDFPFNPAALRAEKERDLEEDGREDEANPLAGRAGKVHCYGSTCDPLVAWVFPGEGCY